jgi:glutathione S-transferase
MRARLALAVSGSTCLLREVKLSNKPVELVEASSKATVPVLVLPGGEVIDESLDIMRWALGRHDPERWLQADPDCTEILIQANDGPFKHHLDRYKYPERHGADLLQHRAAAMALLGKLEERLARQSNLCRETMSLADAAILPFVRQFAQVDRTWFDAQILHHLKRWLEGHISSTLFSRIAVRVPPWSAGDPPVPFPASP